MYVALLWARMPALTTLMEVDLDIALRCARNADGTGIILVARDLH